VSWRLCSRTTLILYPHLPPKKKEKQKISALGVNLSIIADERTRFEERGRPESATRPRQRTKVVRYTFETTKIPQISQTHPLDKLEIAILRRRRPG
jgi:hypothetical protein